MKMILGILAALVFALPAQTAGACPGCDAPEDAAPAPAQQTPLTGTLIVAFQIKGMSCGGCATSLKKALTEIEGVVSADVSYDDSAADVEYLAAKVSPESLMKVIRELGYEVSVKAEG